MDTVELAIWQQQQDLVACAFNAMRKNQFLTDVTLVCEGAEFAVHRALLCASSPFFQAMFKSEYKESMTGEMNFPTISVNSAEAILAFIYTGKIPNIVGDRDKLKCLMEASHLLQLNLLFQYCLQQLSNFLCQTYFLELWHFATLYEDSVLEEKIILFVSKHFFEVCATSEFTNMTVSLLHQVVLESTFTQVWAEDIILDGIMTWVKYNQQERECELKKLLLAIDLKRVSADRLLTCREDTLIKGNSSVSAIIHEEVCRRFSDKHCPPKLLCFGVAETANLMTVYHPKTNTWSKAVALPPQLKLDECMTTVSFDGNVYFLGGKNSEHASDRTVVYKYSPIANVAIRLNDLPVGISQAGAAELEGSIFVVGGNFTGSPQKTVQRVDILKHSSEILCSTEDSHVNPVVIVFQKCIYAVGSVIDAQNTMEKYDPLVDQWTIITKIPRKLWLCQGAIYDGKLFVLGLGSLKNTSGVCTFDFTSNKWHIVGKKGGPEKVCGMWATSLHCILIADEDGEIYSYNVEEGSWMETVVRNKNPWMFNLTTILK